MSKTFPDYCNKLHILKQEWWQEQQKHFLKLDKYELCELQSTYKTLGRNYIFIHYMTVMPLEIFLPYFSCPRSTKVTD